MKRTAAIKEKEKIMKKKTVSKCGARLNFDKEKYIREFNEKKETKKKTTARNRGKNAVPEKIDNDVVGIIDFEKTEKEVVNYE
jgi:hypothetical protein